MLRVVIGVIFHPQNKVLIAQRRKGQFKAGFWEFAGGKIEEGESSEHALKRELLEELAIEVTSYNYHFTWQHHYTEKTVVLEVFTIENYAGTIRSNENQELKWVRREELRNYQLLPTVMPIFNALTLPKIYHIINFDKHFWHTFERNISRIALLQLRSKEVVEVSVVQAIFNKCQEYNITLIVNIPNLEENEKYCHGVHFPSNKIIEAGLFKNKIISCATHTGDEIHLANQVGADIITLSPINKTSTHPDAIPLGYTQAQTLAKKSNALVYFLGGMRAEDLGEAEQYGAFGVAGISHFLQ